MRFYTYLLEQISSQMRDNLYENDYLIIKMQLIVVVLNLHLRNILLMIGSTTIISKPAVP